MSSTNPNVPYPQEPSQVLSGLPPLQSGTKGPWSSGLCDCLSDIPNCCITCWCPCVTFGQIAEIVDRGSTSCGASGALYGLICWFTGCAWIYSCFYRSKMRKQYMLEQSPALMSLLIAAAGIVPCVKTIVSSKAEDST